MKNYLQFYRLITVVMIFTLLSACSIGTEKPPTSTLPAPGVSTSTAIHEIFQKTNEPTAISIELEKPTPTPDLKKYRQQGEVSRSPDGKWVAISVVSYPESPDGSLFADQYHQLLRLINQVDNKEKILIDKWQSFGLGSTHPSVLRWTAEGRYLFFGESGIPDGCGPGFTLNLQRLDLETDEITEITSPATTGISVSPGGDTIVGFNEQSLIVLNLVDSQQRFIPFDLPALDWWAGNVRWSPSGDNLLFSVLINPCGSYEDLRGSIFLADLQTGETRSLILEDVSQFSILSWPEKNLAQLEDIAGNTWWLDTQSGELGTEPTQDIAQAQAALFGFFNALYNQQYSEAITFYGGSYQLLTDQNPDIDPNDQPSLWQNACQVNGAQCLPIKSTILVAHQEPDTFVFNVTFVKDGELYIRPPCCGAEITQMPPEWTFRYSVIKDQDGNYKVQEPPVFEP